MVFDGGYKSIAAGASLCSLSVVELKQPAYPFPALDRSFAVSAVVKNVVTTFFPILSALF